MPHLKASASVVADYFRLFVNRRAYTLQSRRPRPDSGRHYYYQASNRKTGQGLSLTPDAIRRHLEGEGRLQSRSYEDREGQKRNVTEVVVATLRFLGPAKNGNGAKPAESSKAAEPADEADNPFNEPQTETAHQNIPF